MKESYPTNLRVNEFVFHNNADFIEYQKQFLAGTQETNWDPLVMPWVLAPCDECDYVHLTFIPFDGEYEIINNRALLFKGYKEVIIRGQQIKVDGRKPVLKIVNEVTRPNGLYSSLVRREIVDPNTGAISYGDSIEIYHTLSADDAIINIQNTTDNQVNVIISDIDIISGITRDEVEQALLDNGWFRDYGTMLIKVYEASSFKMQNVSTDVRYLNCTNLRLNWCRNVEIVDCDFINYNCQKTGGCLWLEYSAENVRIENNNFFKFGNDEVIAIWGCQFEERAEQEWLRGIASENLIEDNPIQIHPSFPFGGDFKGVSLIEPLVTPVFQWQSLASPHNYAFRNHKFQNIRIENNRFHYEMPYEGCSPIDLTNFNLHKDPNNQEDPWNGVMDIFCAIYFSQNRVEGNYAYPLSHISVESLLINNNEFFIDCPIKGLISFSCDDNTHTRDIEVSNNKIRYSNWVQSECQLADIKIFFDWYESDNPFIPIIGTNKFNSDPIIIKNNTIVSECLPYMTYDGHSEESHSFLYLDNAQVHVVDNRLYYNSHGQVHCYSDETSVPDIELTNTGVELVLNNNKGGSVLFRDNQVDGLRNLGVLKYPNHSTDTGSEQTTQEITIYESRFEFIAEHNMFVGKTNFYIQNLEEGNFVFRDNTFLTYTWIFMFQEFATKGIIIFEDNYVKRIVETGVGRYDNALGYVFFYSNSSNSCDKVDFMRIISKGNEFCDAHTTNVYPTNLNQLGFMGINDSNPDEVEDYNNTPYPHQNRFLQVLVANDKYTTS